MFIAVITEDGEHVVVNTAFIVKMKPKDKNFESGAIIEVAKDATSFSSIHLNGNEAIKAYGQLLNSSR